MHFTQFCETGFSCKVEIPFSAKCTDGTEYQLDVYVASNIAHMKDG
jgi:hypothetical protein